MSMARDNSKYFFDGEKHCKRRLVLAVVKKYLHDNPNTTYDELKRIFPDKLHPSLGVFQKKEDAGNKRRDPEERYFMKPEELLVTGDGMKICVCSQWGDTIERHVEFIEHVKEKLKYEIEKAE